MVWYGIVPCHLGCTDKGNLREGEREERGQDRQREEGRKGGRGNRREMLGEGERGGLEAALFCSFVGAIGCTPCFERNRGSTKRERGREGEFE